ncbi:hypothetical protein [Zooshikella sp. RANM57]|uniref:hypothetical protein n=1 Tax=Zooshikella sp. RANM57 TaxID=3425863 RepID=UPI003D6E0CE9
MKKILLASVILSVSQVSWAAPTFKTCSQKIKAPELGTGVLFDEGCNTAYVLPPVFGDVKVSGIAPNMNVGFCSNLKNTQEGTKAISASLQNYTKRLDEINLQIQQEVYERVVKLYTDLAPIEASKKIIEEEKAALSQRESLALEGVVTAKNDYLTCKKIAVEPLTECAEEYDAYKEGKAKYAEVSNLLNEKSREYFKTAREYETIMRQIEAEDKKVEKLTASQTAIVNKLNELEGYLLTAYKNYAGLEGMTASLAYYMPWMKLVDDYQQLNPGVNFVQMPIKNASFHVHTFNAELGDIAARLPAALSVRAAGITSGVLEKPSGDGTEPQRLKDPSNKKVMFGTSFSGQVRLSLVGACPLLDIQGNVKPDVTEQLHAYMAPNAFLEYEVKVRRGYTANYNLYRMYEKIVKSKSKRGLFKSKKKTKITENKDGNEGFAITFDGDSGEFSYSDEEQNKITQDVLNTLLNRVLQQVSSFSGIGKSVPQLEAAPLTGTGKLAAALEASCGKPNTSGTGSTTDTPNAGTAAGEGTTTETSGEVATTDPATDSAGSGATSEANANETNTENTDSTTANVADITDDPKYKVGMNLACMFTSGAGVGMGDSSSAGGGGAASGLATLAATTGNYYIAAIAAVASMFGSSSSELHYKDTLNIDVSETVNGVSFVDRATSITFIPGSSNNK